MIRESEQPDKKTLRKQWASTRDALGAEWREQASVEASARLAAWVEAQGIGTVMVYSSFRSELDLRAFIERCWQMSVEVILPRCKPADYSMGLYAFTEWEQLKSGAYGIMEPDPSRMTELPGSRWPELVVVPGLAFDRMGGRMGYGAGYYDRYAEAANRSAAEQGVRIWWIGAGFEAQLVERVPMEGHDLRLDGVVTEKAIYLRDSFMDSRSISEGGGRNGTNPFQ
ncbi:5-formyltetrahydrofolate cyclo-ligase [Paenibacillus sp. PL2-23]|uniref:5-formyltetrahydrofolate cyclo-ligase n=1 Tax=Paenibacillus sp. PL2-23 TaxID=2100729 RepID=UPI0030F73707